MRQTDTQTHDHVRAFAVAADNERKVLLSFCLILAFMVVEVIGGLVSGSLALLADAGHMVTDAVALALAYVAFRLGRRSADARRTFGYLRFEVVAGFVNAITLFAIVVWITYEAWQRFQQPQVVLAGPMFGVAALGLVINVLVLWILTRGDTGHVNIRGAALHVLGDLLGSIAVVTAAVVIHFTGWMLIDPVLSVVVSLLILRSAWNLFAESLHILLEGAPDNASPAEIQRYIATHVMGVAAVGHVHVWSITSGRTLATLHVRPDSAANAPRVTRAVEDALRSKFRIEHATVALDWNADAATCSLSRASACDSVRHAHGH